MGVLGSLLYPGNAELSKKLNEDEDKLRQSNNLHNDLVNSYRLMGESIKSFDAYLMSIMAMQYYMVYTEEDLSNLPDEKLPAMSKYWADTVETLAMDTLTVKMSLDGFNAIKNGVGNLFKEGGIFNRTAANPAEAAEALQSEVEAVGLREPLLNTGEVGSLTTESAEVAEGLGTELGAEAAAVSTAIEAEAATAELSEGLQGVSESASAATEGAELVEEGASLGGKLVAGASAALGPVLLVVTVVTEILSAIHAGQEHSKLEAAAKKMDEAQKKLDKSVDDLKNIFKKLLNAGKRDVQTYNKLLPELAALEHSTMFDRSSFSTAGIDSYISGMSQISITNTGVNGYQVAALQNLTDATDFIRTQATHDSKMTLVIKQLKSYMRKNNITELEDSDPFLVSVAQVDSIDLKQVQAYNAFREYLAQYASALLPFHKKIQEDTKSGSVPKVPKTVTPVQPTKGFDPKPGDFKIPGVS